MGKLKLGVIERFAGKSHDGTPIVVDEIKRSDGSWL